LLKCLAILIDGSVSRTNKRSTARHLSCRIIIRWVYCRIWVWYFCSFLIKLIINIFLNIWLYLFIIVFLLFRRILSFWLLYSCLRIVHIRLRFWKLLFWITLIRILRKTMNKRFLRTNICWNHIWGKRMKMFLSLLLFFWILMN